MNEFLKSTESVKSRIQQLNKHVITMTRLLTLKQNSIMNKDEEEKNQLEIESTNNSVGRLGNEITNEIEKLKEMRDEMERTGMSSDRLKQCDDQINIHSTSLKNTLNNYKSKQFQYKNQEKGRLKEIIAIANANQNEEEVNKLVNEDQGDVAVASALALGSHTSSGILKEAQDRVKRIDRIIESLDGLIEMINRIDKLVKEQAPAVDEIVINMNTAETHTRKANEELVAALEYERKVRWFKWILFIILVALGLFLFGGLIYLVIGLIKNFRWGGGRSGRR